MLACYDLSRNPPTYDVVAFLALLELERMRQGQESVELFIKPGPAGGFRRDNLWPRSPEERIELRDHLLIPLCHLLPSICNVVLARPGPKSQRMVAEDERWISLPKILSALRGGSRPLRAPDVYTEHTVSEKRITFTLREAEHHPLRNSNVSEWLRAAECLSERGHRIVIIRDTLRAFDSLPSGFGDLVTSPDAAINLHRRACVYQTSTLNVGVCNGPMWMSIFQDAPTLMLRPVTEAAGGCYDSVYYRKCGLPLGAQLPTSPPHQRLLWEDDSCDNIVCGVEEMLCVAG